MHIQKKEKTTFYSPNATVRVKGIGPNNLEKPLALLELVHILHYNHLGNLMRFYEMKLSNLAFKKPFIL